MPKKSKPKPDIDMHTLCGIVNRQPNSIRRWHRLGLLPEHLLPKRNANKYRIWTHEQVYGKKGILVWMEANNMRPGNLVADPNKVDQHVHNLRKPKKLNGKQLRGVQMMIDNGRSREYILRKLYPRTTYTSVRSLELALTRYYKLNGWTFPPKKRKPYPSRRERMLAAKITGQPIFGDHSTHWTSGRHKGKKKSQTVLRRNRRLRAHALI